jgi:hypothetical protein
MASVPVVIVGTVKDNDTQEEKQVTITGMASIQGLSVGGGPTMPPWWPGHPEHPIPPTIWPTPPTPLPPWWPGHPEHPIPPTIWPTPPGSGGGGGETPPPIEWKIAWSPETGWIVVGIPTAPHPTPSGS